MGKLIINSILYKGDTYFYENKNLKKGVNLLVGDNGNGKSTFTYLLIYCLGLEVDFFKSNSIEPINEIVKDTNNSVNLEITINGNKYSIKRSIGENIIIVHDIQEEKYTSYSVFRKGYIYEKENMTISDWIMEKLGIDVIEIAQNNTFHRINFDDLMRYIYYDQLTENKKIISEFGIGQNDYYKNSNIMKRSIFEVLMSGYNEDYYKTYYKLKDSIKELNNEKQKYKSLEIFRDEIIKQTSIDNVEDINFKLNSVILEIKRLENIRENIKEEQHFGKEVSSRLSEYQKNIIKQTHKLKNLEFDLNTVYEGLTKATRVQEDIQEEIVHIDKILFTSQYVDIIGEEECPFCLEKIDLEEDKCICGSNKHLDFSRFIYSDKEYLNIMKSKVKSLETINDVINGYKEEYAYLKQEIKGAKKQFELIVQEVRLITNDLKYNSNIQSIDGITNQLIALKETVAELKILKEKNTEMNLTGARVEKLSGKVKRIKDKLKTLEDEKDNIFQKNIEGFEEIYSSYLTDFYEDEDIDFNVRLDRNYKPIMGEYKHQSFNVPKRLFFYLTLLKLSLDKNFNIFFPRILIIDTLKAEGIEIPHLKKLFSYIEEFNDEDCQIIITSGYDEYDTTQKQFLIDYLSNEKKLLIKRKRLKKIKR